MKIINNTGIVEFQRINNKQHWYSESFIHQSIINNTGIVRVSYMNQ